MIAAEDDLTEPPSFPPLMEGLAAPDGRDPFALACDRARAGCDAGLVVHNTSPDILSAALVLAPEVPLADAMIMLPTCGIGFQNALGVLAPPEVAVQLAWDGEIMVNGACCGAFRVAASGNDPTVEPDWLVIGFDLRMMPLDPETPGLTPDQTSLYDEGCAEVVAPRLLEAWARHSLVWINRWQDEGTKPLHAEWRGLAFGLGKDVKLSLPDGTTLAGHFLGVDERFGLLLRPGGQAEAPKAAPTPDTTPPTTPPTTPDTTTRLVPLTDLLQRDTHR